MELSKCAKKNIAGTGSLKVSLLQGHVKNQLLSNFALRRKTKKRMIQRLSDSTWFAEVKVQYVVASYVVVLCFMPCTSP